MLPAGARAAAGDLDPSFSSDGRVALLSAGSFVPRAVAIQPDGRIVVAGYSCEPDPSSQEGTGFAALADIAPGPNGTILAAGQVRDGSGALRFAVARFTATGALDGSFGTGGITIAGPAYGFGLGLAPTPDGGAIAAGVAGDS